MDTAAITRAGIENTVKNLLRQYNAESAILFGSYARGEETEHSDIDLVVIGGGGFDPTDIFAFAEDLHEQTKKAVNVYELRELEENTPFYEAVFAEGVRIAGPL